LPVLLSIELMLEGQSRQTDYAPSESAIFSSTLK